MEPSFLLFSRPSHCCGVFLSFLSKSIAHFFSLFGKMPCCLKASLFSLQASVSLLSVEKRQLPLRHPKTFPSISGCKTQNIKTNVQRKSALKHDEETMADGESFQHFSSAGRVRMNSHNWRKLQDTCALMHVCALVQFRPYIPIRTLVCYGTLETLTELKQRIVVIRVIHVILHVLLYVYVVTRG